MNVNHSAQLSLMASEGSTPATPSLLAPYAAANLARILAGCFLTGTATGFNRNDTQSRSDNYITVYEKTVPKSAIDQCSADGGVPVIVQLRELGIAVTDANGLKTIRCPIATNHIKCISFATQKELEETSARISRFQDVPWSSFQFDVDPSLFSDQDGRDSFTDQDIQMPTEANGNANICRALKIGGTLVGQLALVKTSEAFDGWLTDIYKNANRPDKLGDTIYQVVVDDLKAGSGDRAAWDFCWSYVSLRDSADGFSSSDFLDHVRSKALDLPEDAKKQIEKWVEFCSDVISAKREFPSSWQDSQNPALRAVLVFMLTYSREKLWAFLQEYEVGARITMFAESLVGQFETIKRVPVKEKAPSREALDLLSCILVEVSYGNSIGFNVGDPSLSPDGNLENKICFGDQIVVSRRKPISQPYLEIFAKAQRLAMTHGYSPEIRCFYIERQTDKEKKGEALRIYVSVEDTNDRRSQKRARFYIPIKSFATTRAPASKILKQSLEDAWKYGLGVGIFEQGERHVLAYFWMHMVDTFDAIEFADMVQRFESALLR